jgi:glycosyltransferase involved in cell wall biosynthesis
MRIGLVTTSYPRDPDDPAGTFVAGHVRALAAAGCRVEVVAAGARRTEDVDGDGARVVRVPAAPGLFYRGGAPEALARGGAWLAAARFSAALTAVIARRARNWDAIVAHWLAPSALAAALASRLPLQAIAHSGDVHLLGRLGLTAPAAALLAARRAHLCFVSEELRRRFFAAAGPAPVRARLAAAAIVTPMGIDAARFAALAGAARAEPPVVLALGRLVPVKGAAQLIAAAARLRQPARIVLAGAGPDAAALRRAAAGCPTPVELVGEVRGAARDRLLASARVLVVPSIHVEGGRTEGLPLAALEAMAARVPVVASAVGGLAALGDAIRLVPPADPDALAAAVDDALADPDGGGRLAHAATVAQGCDWAVVGRVLRDQLGNAVNEKI